MQRREKRCLSKISDVKNRKMDGFRCFLLKYGKDFNASFPLVRRAMRSGLLHAI